MKRLLGALALAALVPASLSFAEPGEQDVDQAVYTHEPLPVAVATTPPVAQIAGEPFTRNQQQALAQGRMVRPGIYRLRSVHAGLCANMIAGPQLFLNDCRQIAQPQSGGIYFYYQYFVVLPHPSGGHTMRAVPQREAFEGWRPPSPGEIGNCTTVARNVLIGAARIEMKPCDVTDGDWTTAGATDQRFHFLKTGIDTYQISLVEVGDGADCWVVRDGGRTVGTEIIRWACARTADQLWEVSWVEPVPAGYENFLLDRLSWYRTPSGHFNILAASGVDLTGPTYSSFDTANDAGDYCKKRCAELDQCKAWTWTGPAYVANSNDPPRCYWKSAVGEPVNRGPSAIGRLRSGIVRP